MRVHSATSRLQIALPIFAMLAIQVASGIPGPFYFEDSQSGSLEARASQVLFTPGDSLRNVLHVPVFAVLTALWWWSLTVWFRTPRQALKAALAISLTFAVANELSQIFVPTRMATLPDVALNVAGVTLGALAIRHALALPTAA